MNARRFAQLAAVAALGAAPGCAGVRYVAQGACGQLGLWSDARSIDEVVQDPNTKPRTRQLLHEVAEIKAWGSARGLSTTGNYEAYVERPGEYVVWFVNASDRLSFTPRTFWFPVVGSFPGLSWFEESAAREMRQELESEGYDASVRGVGAFSTGGWFDDPVLWTMFDEDDHADGSLANVILHESLHATVFVNGQQYFNESLASYVADTMTPEYLAERFGAQSAALGSYLAHEAKFEAALAHIDAAYAELDAVYRSITPDVHKLEQKQRVLDALGRVVDLDEPPNNATLLAFQLYRVGKQEFGALFASCGRDWGRFLAATSSLRSDDFGSEQREEFGDVLDALAAQRCEPLPRATGPSRRWRTKQEAGRRKNSVALRRRPARP